MLHCSDVSYFYSVVQSCVSCSLRVYSLYLSLSYGIQLRCICRGQNRRLCNKHPAAAPKQSARITTSASHWIGCLKYDFLLLYDIFVSSVYHRVLFMLIVLYCTWLCYTPPSQPITPLNPLTRDLHLFSSVPLLFSSLFSLLSLSPLFISFSFLIISDHPFVFIRFFLLFFPSFLFFLGRFVSLFQRRPYRSLLLYFLRSLTTLASRLPENPVISRRQSSLYLRFPIYATEFLTQTGEDCRLYSSFRFLYTAA